ncbi:MAG: hypothetical protein QOE05_1927 [Actinomycetota bacterium]|jgi:hypothetical protein|nr:hypothetical protein [Actinomycetota bacterium]
MSDVLDNERGPAPFWVVPVAMLAAVAVVMWLAWHWHTEPSAAPPRPSPSASPTPERTLVTTQARNGCGGDVERPLIDAGSVPPGTGLRLLVGDRDLRSVDVDTGNVEVLAPLRDERSFTELTQTATQVLAVLRNPCTVEGYGKGVVAAVDPVDGEVSSPRSGDVVLPGEPPSVLDLDASRPMLVRELRGQASSTVPGQWQLHARVGDEYFVSVSSGTDAPPQLGIGSPKTGALTSTFGSGTVVAASGEKMFWVAGDCDVHCMLVQTYVDGSNVATPLDTAAWGGSVSPDGTKLAFRKPRPSGRLGEHPGPPNDVAILDTTAEGVRPVIVPGLVLPAKAGLTLTWSPDSQWLVIGADLGTGPAILIWRQGMDAAAEIRMPATPGGTTGPPALLVLPR